jgi:hypothetical protein
VHRQARAQQDLDVHRLRHDQLDRPRQLPERSPGLSGRAPRHGVS